LNDRNRWLVAAELNTASGYRDYLTALPDGRWRIDAGKGIENLYEQAMQHYQVSRSAGWNVQASGAVLTVLEYAKRSQRPEVYVDFVRHQQTTLPYTNIKASQDEAQTFSELRARLISMFPEDILRLVQGNPGESAPYLLITYTVASGSSEYVAEDPSTDPFISLGDGPIGHHSIRLDWGCEVRVPERGTIYRYAFVTKPRARLGMSKSVYDSDSIYHAMFFDCFFAFRRDLIQRLGIFI
jgi:hypothetical protein